MSGGFTNRPKILRGAFVEYGLSLPPLFVAFQFNPVQLTRNRALNFSVPGRSQPEEKENNSQSEPVPLRQFHQEAPDLTYIRDHQKVEIQEESLGFEIRLDATDKLNTGDPLAEQFGIAPQLATLELMVQPKGESLIGAALGALLGPPGGFGFTKGENPPLILFIWGRKRVLPVNINSLNITETEFSTDLNPIRATVAVSLTVIEGKSPPYLYSKAMKEAMSVLNLTNVTDIVNIMIPG